jgi:hypothetical protein
MQTDAIQIVLGWGYHSHELAFTTGPLFFSATIDIVL